MALDKNKLLEELKKFCIGKENLPKSFVDSAESWSKALKIYASDIQPQSVTLDQAKEAFKILFLTMNFSGNGLVVFPQCFQIFQVVLSTGMIGYVSVPPPLLIDFNQVKSLADAGGTNIETLVLLCDLIHSNFLTGLATDTSSTTINWS